MALAGWWLATELLLQLTGYPADGRLYALGAYPLRQTPTLQEWRDLYADLGAGNKNYFVYDSLMGWSYRPSSVSRDGLFHFNAAGLRGTRDFSRAPHPDTIRILLLGNSVMFSDEVADTQSLGYYLEETLAARGLKVEVLNAAVGSYGNDQALLRWQNLGRHWQPDIVIQGIHEWDKWINQNVFKYCMFPPTGIAYTKPRAVLQPDSTLRWYNFPTLAPDKIVDSVIVGYESQPYFEAEHFQATRRYGRALWEYSYTFLAFRRMQRAQLRRDAAARDAAEQLQVRLVMALHDDVVATGAQHIMLRWTTYEEALRLAYLGQKPVSKAWTTLKANGLIGLDTSPFAKGMPVTSTYLPSQSHHTPSYNEFIAEVFVEYLEDNNLVQKAQPLPMPKGDGL